MKDIRMCSMLTKPPTVGNLDICTSRNLATCCCPSPVKPWQLTSGTSDPSKHRHCKNNGKQKSPTWDGRCYVVDFLLLKLLDYQHTSWYTKVESRASSGARARLCKTWLSAASLKAAKSDLGTGKGRRFGIAKPPLRVAQEEFNGLAT